MKSNVSSNNFVVRKNDKPSNNYNSASIITSNRFSSLSRRDSNGNSNFSNSNRNYAHGHYSQVNNHQNKTNFFTARKQNNQVAHHHHPHHHSEFHRSHSNGSNNSNPSEQKAIQNLRNFQFSKDSGHSRTFNSKKNNLSSESVCTNGRRSSDGSGSGCGYNRFTPSINVVGNGYNISVDQMKKMTSSIQIDEEKAAQESVKALETLQQIQEAKPGNKRALIVDLPPYLYSIPALASFFEPYGEVAMLQILPQKRMWDADLIDLLGASMCNRLANQSLCAIVEFYSARMAKFIIGILRKRLPVLKFRCALLKPSAAIELTNQAENLGLTGVVVMKNKPKAKNTSQDSSRNTSLNVSGSSSSSDQDYNEQNNDNNETTVANLARIRRSESESGCEGMSSSSNMNSRNPSATVNRQVSFGLSDSNSEHGSVARRSSASSGGDSPAESAGAENTRMLARRETEGNIENKTASQTGNVDDVIGQKFVTSLNIKLNNKC